MWKSRTYIIISLTLIILVHFGCKQVVNNDLNPIDDILQLKFPNHFPDETIDALILREIVKNYVNSNDTANFTSFLKENLYHELYKKDSVLYFKIKMKIETDTNLVKDCYYLINVLSCNDQYQSKHFTVYNLNSKVDTQQINQFDKQYEMLQLVFNNKDSERLNLVLDTTLNYWRAFPIWDVKYGLLQRYVNGNPHELVHHFFTKYSDVPFFQEPMGFLYGDYRNDTAKFYNTFTKNNEQLTINEYVLAKDVWHFPAIVLLEKNDKLSFWLFTSTLMQKYGISKFIQFAKITTWGKNNDEFEQNFNTIYQIPLETFEKKNIIEKLKNTI